MNNAYQDSPAALKYLDFLNSENGQIQQEVLLRGISGSLPKNPELMILDAGCGSGWLAAALKKNFKNLEACDSSDFLVQFAKVHNLGPNYKIASLDQPLPYQKSFFDVAILNMVGPDLSNLDLAFANISSVLNQSGKLLMTIPNPAFTYPAAEWKRNELDFILRRKPKLVIYTPPSAGQKIKREFGKNSTIDSYYYPLDSYITSAHKAGLELKQNQALPPAAQSQKFNLNYQLSQYPLLQLLEFQKISEM
jgi:SAM-dependent methyltransferase